MLSATGDKGQARPAFTDQEIAQLLSFMPTWEFSDSRPRNQLMRFLLSVYVEFLLYTGIRQGTESWPIRWKHLQWDYIGQDRHLRIWVSGKTGPRYLIAIQAGDSLKSIFNENIDIKSKHAYKQEVVNCHDLPIRNLF
jgi:hypothetical protein